MNKLTLILLTFIVALTTPAQANKKLCALGDIILSASKNASKHDASAVAKRATALQAKWGDDVLVVAKKHGVRSLKAIEDAGEHGGTLVRLQKNLGEEAIYLAKNKRGLSIIGKLGDDIAPSLIKHGGSANDLLASYGVKASKSLTTVGRKGCAQLTQLHDAGLLSNTGDKAKLFDVVGKYGQRGLDFIWKNKTKLAAAGVLTTFVLNPEPYINGTVQLADSVIDNASEIGSAVASKVNWNLWIGVSIALITLLIVIKYKIFKSHQTKTT